MIYVHHYYILFVYITYSLCRFSTASIMHDIDETNDKFTINVEEALRRHKLVEPHLSKIAETEKDWIETYHLSFGANEIPSNNIPKTKYSASKDEYAVNNDVPTEEEIVDTSEQKSAKVENDRTESPHYIVDSDKQISSDDDVEPPFASSEAKFSISSTEERLLRHEIADLYLSKHVNLEKETATSHLNNEVINPAFSPGNIEKSKSSVSKDKFTINPEELSKYKIVDSSLMKSTNTEKDMIESHHLTIDCYKHEISPDNIVELADSESKAKSPIHIETLFQHKDMDSLSESADIEKYIEIGHLNSEASKSEDLSNNLKKHKGIMAKDKFTINSEELSKNQIVDSSSIKFTKTEKVRIESHHLTIDSGKQGNSLNNIEELNNSVSKTKFPSNNEELYKHKIKDSSLCDATDSEKCVETNSKASEQKIFLGNFEKHEGIVSRDNLPVISEEIFHRQKSVNSYVSALEQTKKNWKETYHFSYEQATPEKISESPFSDFNSDKRGYDLPNLGQDAESIAKVLKPVHSQERLYFIRWAKKLLNKFDGYSFNQHISIEFSFTVNSLKSLKELSENLNFDTADELISNLISNATIYHASNSNSSYETFISVGYYFIGFVLLILLYFIILFIPYAKLILFVSILLFWHATKMYQEKVAEKHATLSGSTSSYCESILTQESGIFDHFKEYLRYNTYDEHCKKYFDALMVDPLSELSLFIVVSDYVSSIFCQLFRPIGRTLNAFVKDLAYDLTLFQTFFLIILLTFGVFIILASILICQKYKLKFPFFLGSIEPSVVPVGSRVEDLTFNKEESTLKILSSKKHNVLLLCHKQKCTHSQMQNKSDFQQNSKTLLRRCSF